VNRLPPEVIALCATFVSDTDPKSIIPLTHVCQYWRRAIASSPRNWSPIGSGWKPLVPLCLERSTTVPLSVKISVSDVEEDEDFLQALVPHTSRISNLSLTGYSSIESVADDLPGLFTSPMPALTSLELEQTDQPTQAFPSDEASTPPLFRNISNLRTLHFVRTPLYPVVFSIASLVELELVDYASPFHFGDFIEFLHSNQSLEVVTLYLQFSAGSRRISPERKAPLPQLQRLMFTCGNATDARALLSWVSLRRGSHITIRGSQSNSSADLASFLPSPPTSIQELLTPITAIKYYPPRWFYISGGDGTFSFQPSKPPPTMYDGLELFTTGTAREFHLHASSSTFLSLPLGRLPGLEALVLSGMRPPLGPLTALAKEGPPCPSLKTIAFFNCEVTKDVIKELEEVLAKRRDSTAARLYRVVIVNTTHVLPDYHSIRRLRNVVPRVDVGVGDELPVLL